MPGLCMAVAQHTGGWNKCVGSGVCLAMPRCEETSLPIQQLAGAVWRRVTWCWVGLLPSGSRVLWVNIGRGGGGMTLTGLT
jgi:hypothetical protein